MWYFILLTTRIPYPTPPWKDVLTEAESGRIKTHLFVTSYFSLRGNPAESGRSEYFNLYWFPIWHKIKWLDWDSCTQASLKSALPKKTPILPGITSQNVPILRGKRLLCLQFQACFVVGFKPVFAKLVWYLSAGNSLILYPYTFYGSCPNQCIELFSPCRNLGIHLFKINNSLNSHSKSLNMMQKQGKSAQCAANSVHFLAGQNYSDKSANESKLRMIKSGSLSARSTIVSIISTNIPYHGGNISG